MQNLQKVNFYELRSVVAWLIHRIRYFRIRKNLLGRRLVNYDLGGCVKNDTSHISMYLNARNQYIHIYMLLYVRCAVLVFSVIYGRIATSLD